VNTHVNVLMPAFQMQSAIQAKVLGRKFWGRITRKRLSGIGADEVSDGGAKGRIIGREDLL